MNAAPTSATPSPARLNDDTALEWYRTFSLHELGRRACERTAAFHPEPWRTYVVDRNINYANVCTSRCTFCNFFRPPGDPDAYILSFEEIGRKIEELISIGGSQILMQGGLLPDASEHPDHGRPLDWYLDLFRFIKQHYPGVHIHALSPPEIWSLHQHTGLALGELIETLRQAGLNTIPGGGGEILVDRVRHKISPRKCTADQWLEVMRCAHHAGLKTSCTMMFGHIETRAERIEHLRRLRELQDETNGFSAFIPWPFQPDNTPLGRWPHVADAEDAEPDGQHLHIAGACEYLRLLALARIYLDNIPNIQASWVTMGPRIGQIALFFGANDMGSVMMEENVVSSAGTTFRLNEDEIRHLIATAGYQPRRRDQHYRLRPEPAETAPV